jgi:Fic family protein
VIAVKMPAPPPDGDKMLEKLAGDRDRLVRVLSQTAPGASTEKYFPWDKLRFKTPPEGLTHEEWWIGIRLARRSMERTLPFVDKKGKHFTYAIPDEVLRALDEIGRRASGEIAISEQVTNPATRDRYIVNSLIEEAITSSQLEGASTSRGVAKEMIRSGRAPRDKSERMILNNYRAMRRVSELRHKRLSPELVCELHRIVTDGTLADPDSAGRIQENPDPADRVAVYGDTDQVIHRPPPVDQLHDRLELLCQFANGELSGPWVPPVVRALTIHFMVGYDHYFEDGNGRTARALFYWSMLRQGYWLTEFLTISSILKKAPAQYARSFVMTEQDEGDLTHFRQLKTPAQVYTVQSHAASHNVSNETARQDLMNLEGRGLLESARIRRRFVWHAVDNLSRRIREDRTTSEAS